MQNKYVKRADKLFFKSFELQKLPIIVHELNLDLGIDYIISLGKEFQKDARNLNGPIIDIKKDTKIKINSYIGNNKNENGHDMNIYYLMIKTAIQILLRYYNKDGTLR